jgi:hypothetical protein
MTTKPSLDTMILLAQTNEHPAFLIAARMIEESTPVLNVNVLHYTNARTHGGGMTEDKHTPAFFLGVLLQQVFQPNGLGLGDVDLVGGEGGGTEAGRAQANAQGFLPDLMAKGGEFQSESVLPGLQVFDVRSELVHAL